jgi:hypothetical protein
MTQVWIYRDWRCDAWDRALIPDLRKSLVVMLERAVRFLRLRGGDVNGDFGGVPASRLAVFPGTTHSFGLSRTRLVLDVVTTFLDAPEAAS